MTRTILAWDPGNDAPILNGAKGRKRHTRHKYTGPYCDCRIHDATEERDCCCNGQGRVCWDNPIMWCVCGAVRDPIASRRSRNNGKRGRRAELTIAREIPGARKMGPLGLPWDVEVGEYARLQVKKLVARPSANAIRKLIEAIPNTGDRLRGFVWVEAAGQGKHGRREVTFLAAEFAQWHGWDWRSIGDLVTLALADWVAEFVS
jgi:hypothetical protein